MNTDINEWQDYILYINWLNNNVLTFNDYMEQMQCNIYSMRCPILSTNVCKKMKEKVVSDCNINHN